MRKRNVFSVLIFLIIVMIQIVCMADEPETNTYGDFEYVVTDNLVTITKYNGTEENVIIPNQIESANVYSIGMDAFSNNNLKSVIIPDTVVSIDWNAFNNCINLESVKLSERLYCIQSYAFYNCEKLNVIEIPASIGYINHFAFKGCENLEKFISYSTKQLDYCGDFFGASPTYCDTNFNNLTILGYKNSWAESYANSYNINFKLLGVNTVIFKDYDGTVLKTEEVEEGKSATAPNNPSREGYTFIGWDKMFDNVTEDLEITAQYQKNDGSGTKSYGDFEYIIDDNDEITITKYTGNSSSVLIPSIINQKNVIKISAYAFIRNFNILSVEISAGITTIDYDAFYMCKNLKQVILPNSITSIGDGAFIGCNQLSNINLPVGLISIGHSAFANCESLTEVIIPNSVTSIGYSAFDGCTGLKNITISRNITKIEKDTFHSCNNLVEVIIPDNIISIEDWAFAWCTELKSIIIPDNVTNISSQAFYASNNIIIYGYSNSYAEIYAKEKRINFVALNKENEEEQPITLTPYTFNPTYYADNNTDLKNAFGYIETALQNHYINYGIKEGRQATPIFNPQYYLNKYEDLKNAFGNNYIQAYNHFMNYGLKEGRQGSKEFNVKYYLDNNGDLKQAFGSDYKALATHYVCYGKAEGRIGSGETPINITNYMFDADLYYNLYGDLQTAIGYNVQQLKAHYLNYGLKEGRVASYVFDPIYYLYRYGDLKNAFTAIGYEQAYNHFINNGINEGRIASKYFDAKYYLKNNKDLENAFGTNYSKALEHFINYGINECRIASSEFNIKTYKNNYRDLQNAFKNNWKQYYNHYIIWGQKENRKCI